jgi:hypothetical protein
VVCCFPELVFFLPDNLLTNLKIPSKTPLHWKKPSRENTFEDSGGRITQHSPGNLLMRRSVRGKSLVQRSRKRTLISLSTCGLR